MSRILAVSVRHQVCGSSITECDGNLGLTGLDNEWITELLGWSASVTIPSHDLLMLVKRPPSGDGNTSPNFPCWLLQRVSTSSASALSGMWRVFPLFALPASTVNSARSRVTLLRQLRENSSPRRRPVFSAIRTIGIKSPVNPSAGHTGLPSPPRCSHHALPLALDFLRCSSRFASARLSASPSSWVR